MNLTLEESAVKFISRMLRFDGGPGAGFRLAVKPGGCSGLAAEFSVEKTAAPDEKGVTVHGLTLFLNAESRLLLDGATIAFADTAHETGFVFRNTKHTPTCETKPALVSLSGPGAMVGG